MASFPQIIMAAQRRDGTSGGSSAWSAILEVTVVMFFVALIPKMIALDPQNIHWYDFWEPFLSAALAALYTYVRARGIKLEETISDEPG